MESVPVRSAVYFFSLLSILTLSLLYAPLVQATSGDVSNTTSIITVTASFCDSDLICDPEENYDSCPIDCPAPVEEDSGDSGARPSSGLRTRFDTAATTSEEYFRMPPGSFPQEFQGTSVEEVVTFVEDLVSQQITSESDVFVSVEDQEAFGLFAQTLRAAVDQEKREVMFTWQAQDRMVRMLRDTTAFPTSFLEGGVVVYDGTGTTYTDTNLEKGKTYYYSFFVQDSSGNFSYRERMIVRIARGDSGEAVSSDSPIHKKIPDSQKILFTLGILFLLLLSWKLFTRSVSR